MPTQTKQTHDQERAAARYLGTIKNPHKRSYGVKYWAWLTTDAEFPDYDTDALSYMAAQAVRTRLVDIKAGVAQ